MCSDTPLNHYVSLAEPCNLFYYNGNEITATNVDIGSCSMNQCTAYQGPCENGTTRCCCQPLQYYDMEYQCQNKPLLLFSHIVSRCGCKPCNITVSFVGLVNDPQDSPVVLAPILVDGTNIVYTDRYGMFGFTMSGLQYEVDVATSITSYAPYQSTFPIIPGTINLIFIQLLEMQSETYTLPKNSSLLLSSFDLTRYNSVSEFMSKPSNHKGDSLISFPAGYFRQISLEDCQFQVLPVEMNSDKSIRRVRTSFLTEAISSPMIAVSKRQMNNLLPACVTAVSFGSLQMMNTLGQPIIMNSSMEITVITFFSTNSTSYEYNDLAHLQLYVYNVSVDIFQLQASSPEIHETNHSYSVTFQIPNIIPITYIIAYRDEETCYTIARVFNTQTGSPNDAEVHRQITFTTRQSVRAVSLVHGESKQCISIPCSGLLSVIVDDYFNTYQPAVITYNLSESVSEMPGPIHASIDDCVTKGMEGDDSIYFFTFTQVSSIPKTPPTDTLQQTDDIDTAMYCYIHLQINYCFGYSTRVVVTSSFKNREIEHVRFIGHDTQEEDYEEGSGVGCYSVDDVCMEYMYDPFTVVNITVSHCPYANCTTHDYSYCYPVIHTTRYENVASNSLHNTEPLTSPFFAFKSIFSSSGLYYSEHNSDIAFYKCVLGNEIAIKYECVPVPDLALY